MVEKMIGILLSDNSFEQDIRELLMAFCPGNKFTHEEEEAVSEAKLIVRGERAGDEFCLCVETRADENGQSFAPPAGTKGDGEDCMVQEAAAPSWKAAGKGCVQILDGDRLETKNRIKRELYRLMSGLTGRTLPWGTLTGIRPTKIALTRLYEGMSEEEIRDYMRETYLTSREKIELSLDVARREKELLSAVDYENGYSLYIGIPFCPTTCLYCSFTSFPIGKWQGRTGLYLNALFREMDYVAEKMKGRPLDTVYFGGGTPTSLSPEDLDAILDKVERTFPMDQVKEFTVEAGRPDSITEEKLQVLRNHGITRISINPQTMKQETLDLIGRRHTVEQVKETFRLARRMGFDNINMDLIVGLPEEDEEDVRNTMEQIKELRPDSLTVHSLAIKRAARLNMFRERYGNLKITGTQEMIDMTARYAREMGMEPYYLYRQKNMAGNFENVGYSVPGKACIYNILIMEEKQTIMACGAGTTTKVVFPGENRLERAENVKEVEQYIERMDEMLERKEKLIRQLEG